MSKLLECESGVRGTLEQLTAATKAHRVARDLYAQLLAGADASVQGLGLELRLATGESIPIPFPQDREQLINMLGDAVSFLGNDILRCWDTIHDHSSEAVRHGQEARQRLAEIPLSAGEAHLPTATIPLPGS